MDLRDQLQQTIGNSYTIERELGGGGMSRVFLAEERRLHRKVVIKLLSPELAAGVSAERFEREIQLAASLQQANIVPILAAGDSQGIPFYTMPYVEGESLRARLSKDGPLPVAMVVGILRDVAKALAYAHERGVVHRDIKPDNVLFSGGTAVVTDFGIAKAISAARESTPGATLTQMGTSIGTPAYMSPEQAAGDPDVDHRADIYSLGCMAHELLTGQAPFAGRTPARTLAAHMSETPAAVIELRPDTPPALAAFITRCLEKEPTRRPQTGAEIVLALDAVSSGGLASTHEVLRTPALQLGRTLALYATAFIVVAIVARAAVIALGVPDWFFPGVMVVMALGLPVMLFTWYVNRTMRTLASSSGPRTNDGVAAPHGTMQTLAVKASPIFTWRRAWIGGVATMGAFILLVGGFMSLRAMGIGPAGSLRGAGRFGDRERLIVTEFQSTDSTLVSLVTEAVRTTLGQSRVISIMPPAAIAASLQRMQRPVTGKLDLALATEIAKREGVKAIVDGSLQAVAGGFIVSLRLVSVDSMSSLASYQATASGPQQLLETIDGLTRKLRGKIGESLKEVRGSAPLEQVTTSSLEALRLYADAAKFLDRGGNPVEAATRLREVVKLDTTFAMAYRKLGVALNNAGLPRPGVDSALERAYRFRSRLTERERLLSEGSYFGNGPGRDRREAAKAYEALLALDSTENAAANNLANIYTGRREPGRAEALFKASIAGGRATSQTYTNLISALFNQGKLAEAERLAKDFRERFPASIAVPTQPLPFLYERGRLDSMELIYRDLRKSSSPALQIQGLSGLGNLLLMKGKVQESQRLVDELVRISRTMGNSAVTTVADSLQFSWVDLLYYGDTASAVRRMDRVLAKNNLKAQPYTQRPYLGLVSFFAATGNIPRARQFLSEFESEMPDSSTRRTFSNAKHSGLAVIALAEKKYDLALKEVWASDTTYDGPDGSCTICILGDVAQIHADAGSPDSAIYYFEKRLNTPFTGRSGMDAFNKAIYVRELAAQYEKKGDAVNAAKYYREFIAAWENADAKLQPKVADAKRRLSRLADLEAKPK